MEIGNIQSQSKPQFTDAQKRQRGIDIRNNACTRGQTKYCRLWKCSIKKKVNNVEWSTDDGIFDTVTFHDAVDSGSEN